MDFIQPSQACNNLWKNNKSFVIRISFFEQTDFEIILDFIPISLISTKYAYLVLITPLENIGFVFHQKTAVNVSSSPQTLSTKTNWHDRNRRESDFAWNYMLWLWDTIIKCEYNLSQCCVYYRRNSVTSIQISFSSSQRINK